MDLNFIRREIERMRRQMLRQRKEIQASNAPIFRPRLMARMLTKVDELCAERDRQVREQKIKYPGTNKIINGPIERPFR